MSWVAWVLTIAAALRILLGAMIARIPTDRQVGATAGPSSTDKPAHGLATTNTTNTTNTKAEQ